MTAGLGASLPRQDGPAKVTGAARYAADHLAEGMLYGVLVGAPVPAGRLRAIDAHAARDVPGVTHVLTHAEMPKLAAPPVPPAASVRVPMQDDEIQYEGEPIAIVLAETLEAAEHAASLVQADVEPAPFTAHPRGDRAGAEVPRESGYLTSPADAETAMSRGRSRVRRCATRRPTSSPRATTTRWSPRRRWRGGMKER